MECKHPGCKEQGRFEGWCKFCIGEQWKPCTVPDCDQYTMDPLGLCYQHRGQTDWLSAKDAGKILGLSAKQVQRLAVKGSLVCTKTAGGHRRFKPEDVKALLEE